MKNLTFLLLFAFSFRVFPQTPDIEQLKKELIAYTKSDTVKMRLLTELAWEKYYFDSDTAFI